MQWAVACSKYDAICSRTLPMLILNLFFLNKKPALKKNRDYTTSILYFNIYTSINKIHENYILYHSLCPNLTVPIY